MHSINSLKDTLGLSYQATRNRVILLKEHFSNEVKGGNNSKYTITDNGMEILKQVEEKYDSGNSLKQSFKLVEREISKSTEKQESNKYSEDYINELKERIRFLETQIERKDNQIQQLLPEANQQESEKKSIGERFKSWLGF